MPLLTIVTFLDDEGDEFPVGIHGIPEDAEHAERLARKRGEELEREGYWRPVGEITLLKIEYPQVPQ